MWYAYEDGPDEAIMAVAADWRDGKGKVLMEQRTVAALRPMNGEIGSEAGHLLEIQITLRPPKNAEPEIVELGKSNLGFLSVRMAKTVSAHFGGGRISNSEGQVGEDEIFGQPARWMDYSGPIVVGEGADRQAVTEGVTLFDHPQNPRYPTHWHVRSDGWMCASFCMKEGFTIEQGSPLVLRYLLHIHAGDYDADRAAHVAKGFAKRPGFEVGQRKTQHRHYEVWRKE